VDRQQGYTSLYGEKTVDIVMNLPEKDLTWVVYNANMVGYAETLIIRLRGVNYFNKYVKVVSREDSTGAKGQMYFDPKFFEHIGNGYD